MPVDGSRRRASGSNQPSGNPIGSSEIGEFGATVRSAVLEGSLPEVSCASLDEDNAGTGSGIEGEGEEINGEGVIYSEIQAELTSQLATRRFQSNYGVGGQTARIQAWDELIREYISRDALCGAAGTSASTQGCICNRLKQIAVKAARANARVRTGAMRAGIYATCTGTDIAINSTVPYYKYYASEMEGPAQDAVASEAPGVIERCIEQAVQRILARSGAGG